MAELMAARIGNDLLIAFGDDAIKRLNLVFVPFAA
jgi:hypothetical protein